MSADFEREISARKNKFLSEFFSFAKSSGNGIPKNKKNILMRSFEILREFQKKNLSGRKRKMPNKNFAKAKGGRSFSNNFFWFIYMLFYFPGHFWIRFIYTVTVVIIYFAGDSQGKPIRNQKTFRLNFLKNKIKTFCGFFSNNCTTTTTSMEMSLSCLTIWNRLVIYIFNQTSLVIIC